MSQSRGGDKNNKDNKEKKSRLTDDTSWSESSNDSSEDSALSSDTTQTRSSYSYSGSEDLTYPASSSSSQLRAPERFRNFILFTVIPPKKRLENVVIKGFRARKKLKADYSVLGQENKNLILSGLFTEELYQEVKEKYPDKKITEVNILTESEVASTFAIKTLSPQECKDKDVHTIFVPCIDNAGDENENAIHFENVLFAAKAIDDGLKRGDVVVVHCKSGKGRSALVTTVYEALYGTQFQELREKVKAGQVPVSELLRQAIAFVRLERPSIDLHEEYINERALNEADRKQEWAKLDDPVTSKELEADIKEYYKSTEGKTKNIGKIRKAHQAIEGYFNNLKLQQAVDYSKPAGYHQEIFLDTFVQSTAYKNLRLYCVGVKTNFGNFNPQFNSLRKAFFNLLMNDPNTAIQQIKERFEGGGDYQENLLFKMEKLGQPVVDGYDLKQIFRELYLEIKRYDRDPNPRLTFENPHDPKVLGVKKQENKLSPEMTALLRSLHAIEPSLPEKKALWKDCLQLLEIELKKDGITANSKMLNTLSMAYAALVDFSKKEKSTERNQARAYLSDQLRACGIIGELLDSTVEGNHTLRDKQDEAMIKGLSKFNAEIKKFMPQATANAPLPINSMVKTPFITYDYDVNAVLSEAEVARLSKKLLAQIVFFSYQNGINLFSKNTLVLDLITLFENQEKLNCRSHKEINDKIASCFARHQKPNDIELAKLYDGLKNSLLENYAVIVTDVTMNKPDTSRVSNFFFSIIKQLPKDKKSATDLLVNFTQSMLNDLDRNLLRSYAEFGAACRMVQQYLVALDLYRAEYKKGTFKANKFEDLARKLRDELANDLKSCGDIGNFFNRNEIIGGISDNNFDKIAKDTVRSLFSLSKFVSLELANNKKINPETVNYIDRAVYAGRYLVAYNRANIHDRAIKNANQPSAPVSTASTSSTSSATATVTPSTTAAASSTSATPNATSALYQPVSSTVVVPPAPTTIAPAPASTAPVSTAPTSSSSTTSSIPSSTAKIRRAAVKNTSDALLRVRAASAAPTVTSSASSQQNSTLPLPTPGQFARGEAKQGFLGNIEVTSRLAYELYSKMGYNVGIDKDSVIQKGDNYTESKQDIKLSSGLVITHERLEELKNSSQIFYDPEMVLDPSRPSDLEAMGFCHVQLADFLYTSSINKDGKAIPEPRTGVSQKGDKGVYVVSAAAINFNEEGGLDNINTPEKYTLARIRILNMYRAIFSSALKTGNQEIFMPAAGLGEFLPRLIQNDQKEKSRYAALYFEMLALAASEHPNLRIHYHPFVFQAEFQAAVNAQNRSSQPCTNLMITDQDVNFLAYHRSQQGIQCAIHNASDATAIRGEAGLGKYWRTKQRGYGGNFAAEELLANITTVAMGSKTINSKPYDHPIPLMLAHSQDTGKEKLAELAKHNTLDGMKKSIIAWFVLQTNDENKNYSELRESWESVLNHKQDREFFAKGLDRVKDAMLALQFTPPADEMYTEEVKFLLSDLDQLGNAGRFLKLLLIDPKNQNNIILNDDHKQLLSYMKDHLEFTKQAMQDNQLQNKSGKKSIFTVVTKFAKSMVGMSPSSSQSNQPDHTPNPNPPGRKQS